MGGEKVRNEGWRLEQGGVGGHKPVCMSAW